MRVFAASIILTVLLIAFGLRAEAPVAVDVPGYEYVSNRQLIAVEEGYAEPIPAGSRVELMLSPTVLVARGAQTLLRDGITGVSCAASDGVVNRIGEVGDDFLVVRGVLGDSGELHACEVVGYDGVPWEEDRAAEQVKLEELRDSGRL
jgi:hypothetical protein